MKQILLLTSLLFLFFTVNVNAQLKPAQSQYLVEKGVLINPSFEQGYQGWQITGCTKSISTDVPLLSASLKLTCVNETFSIKQVSTLLTDFKNQQGAFDLQIKTTASGVKVSSITNGVRDSEYSALESTTFKRFKEIGFIVGDTDNGIEVYSDTNFTGEIVLDNVKLGLGNLTQEVGTAHFVGSIEWANNPSCVWVSTSGTMNSFPVDADCVNPVITGNLQVPDTNIPAIKIPSADTSGSYRVVFNATIGSIYNASENNCIFQLTATDSGKIGGGAFVKATSSSSADYIPSLEGEVRFGATGNKIVEIQAQRSSGGGECRVYGRSPDLSMKAMVYFYPDAKSTVVTQDTELTAETANSFSAYVSSSGVVSDESLDWVNGNCGKLGTGGYTCPLNFTLSQKMTCQVVVDDNYGSGVIMAKFNLASSTTSSVAYTTQISSSNTLSDRAVILTCFKSGTDVNKNATIIGKFEQIEDVSEDLTAETANELSASILNAATPTIDSSNYDFIETLSRPVTGRYVLNFKANIFTIAPTCVASPQPGGSFQYANIYSVDATQVTVDIYRSDSNIKINERFRIICSKQGVDVNKNIKGVIINASQTQQEVADIIMENTKSDDLAIVSGRGNAAQAITGSVTNIPFTEIRDDSNIWSGSEIVAILDGEYTLKGVAGFTSSTTRDMYLYIDQGSGYVREQFAGSVVSTSTSYPSFNVTFRLQSGWKAAIRSTGGGTLLNNYDLHWVSVTQSATQESIIANLMQGQTTKCQTKYLSANTSASAIMADLTFNSLVIGKKYSVIYQFVSNANTAYRVYNNPTIGVNDVTRAAGGSSGITMANSGMFTAVTSSLVVTNELTINTYGNGTKNGTWATLCELPDTVIETTEFN